MSTRFLFIGLLLVVYSSAWAYRPKFNQPAKEQKSILKPRENCSQATKQIDQEINNVRARLTNGGDVWTDGNKGRYIVPKIEAGSGKPEVSSIYAGGVWVGGYDPANSLKFMGQTYRRSTTNECWPGPLNSASEATVESCLNWDQFFTVSGDNIRLLKRNLAAAIATENRYELRADEIPEDIKNYPCRGNNDNFENKYGFSLPNTVAGLALFNDIHQNGIYEPQFGEYPVIDIQGCETTIFADEMIYWIYNDNGGIHTGTNGQAIKMEIQVQAFAFRTADELNDMTFQRYKLVNRAPQAIHGCYFAMWIDPDLGCYTDDYI
ncbi:MAG: hypothetical protein ABIO44_06000, partial [Saprospiraceae bacterium]